MARLVWDRLEDRSYEIGADHAVLYVPDDDNVFRGVPWNGLTKVTKDSTRETVATYFDGAKIHDYIKQTEFKGSMSAIMYPPEFEKLEGSYELRCGVYAGEQPPGIFGLSYRSKLGDNNGDNAGYKIHVLYNLHATPAEKAYETMSDSPKLMEFSWTLESIPEVVPKHRPTAEITIDSSKADPLLLEILENILYGTESTEAYLPSMAELFAIIDGWYRLLVTVDDDPDSPTFGMFWVEERFENTHIVENEDGSWVLNDVDATVVGIGTYELRDTFCLHRETDSIIQILDLGNGAWAALTDYDSLITVDDDPDSPTFGMFTIDNATVIWQNETGYRITDTLPD